ncbi:OsmC family protein [Liquorilactobacillus oeni]|nr:OsmC family protein [Liquorilactobacillus oeni]
MMKKILYETEAINQDGLNGQSYVKNGLKVAVSNPREKTLGTNPEQLLGLSLCTCMNATLQAIENEQGLKHTSEVRVSVTLIKGSTGLEFLVKARIHIPDVALSTAQKLVNLAKSRCPVSKLLSNSSNYDIEVVKDY